MSPSEPPPSMEPHRPGGSGPLFSAGATTLFRVAWGLGVFLVAGLIRLGGERAERALHKHIETAGWVIVAIVVALLLWWWLR